MLTLQELIPRMIELGDAQAVLAVRGYRTFEASYSELARAAAGFAFWLKQQGYGPQDRIALWAPNGVEWLAVFWGAVARRVPLVLIDESWSGETAFRLAKAGGAGILVCESTPPGWKDATLRLEDVLRLPSDAALDQLIVAAEPGDVVEIVFTSGTTGEPSGVFHRHRNLCAVLTPIEQEMRRFEKWARPFQPVRTLNLLPLSHMFGQAMGLFVPVILGGSVVFSASQHPGAVLQVIRQERVSVLTAVPHMLRNLRQEIERRFAGTDREAGGKGLLGAARRWWIHRKVHSELGWKFWAVVVGGAALSVEEEAFWRRLGYLVVQGYGMTETSPMITLNHPLSTRPGSVGKPLPGVQVRLAGDGEILVKGANVAESYLGDSEGRFSDGWLRTGDLGEFDSEGRLYIKGRKKDLIVTGGGLNVHPEDVEQVLLRDPRVKAAAAVSGPGPGGEAVHAVIVPADPDETGGIREAANQELEPHQRIHRLHVWPSADLPRTASTGKVRRVEVARWLGTPETAARPGHREEQAEELALPASSLDRVALMAELEQKYGIEIDEERFSDLETGAELQRLVEQSRSSGASGAGSAGTEDWRLTPHWARRAPFRWLRRVLLSLVGFPLLRFFVRLRVEGVENLRSVAPPALFAPNHTSIFDTPVLLMALPYAWRKRIAPAVQQEHFNAYLKSKGSVGKRFARGLEYWLVAAIFQAYPLPRHGAGVRRALKFTSDLVREGVCPVIFPEGHYTPDGSLLEFQPGIGLLAGQLGVPVVPVSIEGMFAVLSRHDSWPRRGIVTVRFGTPLSVAPGESAGAFTSRVRSSIEALRAGKG